MDCGYKNPAASQSKQGNYWSFYIMSEGWVCIHRKMLDWEWFDDHNTFRLFMYLILSANHKDKKWRGINIKRGQHLTSIESLKNKTGLSVSQLRTSISKLKSTNEIASESSSQHTVITVNNYDLYQSNNKPDDNPIANRSQTDSKRVATNNNANNGNNENKKRKTKVLLPSDFVVTESMKAWFDSQGFVVDACKATDAWRNAMMAGGRKYVDWAAAWRNGMIKANEWALEKNPNLRQQSSAKPFGDL